MLQLRHIQVDRPLPGGERLRVLADLSLELAAGRMTAVIGPSGGGKTTLLRLLNRLDDPDAGDIRLAGRSLTELPPVEVRRRVALVPQRPVMFEGTVWDNLRLPWQYRGQPAPGVDSEAVRQALTQAEVSSAWLHRPASDLSGGQQQRVALARTLLTDPQVLLLDEPTSALDRPTSLRLIGGLRQWVRERNRTLLLVTHDLELAALADRLLVLENGRIVEDGPAAELLRQPTSPGLQAFLVGPEARTPDGLGEAKS
jgi:putative ABC transport system ATP-binding protein